MSDTPQHPVPPHPRNGLPRVASGELGGRPPYDWEAVMPELLHRVAGGNTIPDVIRDMGLSASDVYLQLASERWSDQYSEVRRARAVALLERNTQRLEGLADEAEPNKERINAARWSANNAQWLAERSDPERWGREDRLKVQSVSAVRVIVETPPVAAQLPAPQEVTRVVARVAAQLGDGSTPATPIPLPVSDYDTV